MKKISFIALLLISQQSFALLSNNISIRVRSSANYLYPCNAGIAENKDSISKGVDYIKGFWQASQHKPTAGTGDGVAVGGANSGNFDIDYSILGSLLGDGELAFPKFNTLLPEVSMFDFELGGTPKNPSQKVEINLESDTFNAAYFVTFCFKPSKLSHNDDGVKRELIFNSARITHSAVPTNTKEYATDSKLKATLDIKCRTKDNTITQFYAPSGISSLDTLLTLFPENTSIELIPSNGLKIGDPSNMLSGDFLPYGSLPDECRVRFYFFETSGVLRDHVLLESDIRIDLDANVRAIGQ